MTYNDAGRFRGCWMFDTHNAVYHLGDRGAIIGIHCDEIRDEVIGIISDTRVGGYIGNPGVFALENTKNNEDIAQILGELQVTYAQRILRWSNKEEATQIKRAA